MAFPCLFAKHNSRGSYIGVGGQNVPLHRRIVRFYNLPIESGVLVLSTEQHSAAQRAGIIKGDVIIGFDNHNVSSIDELHKLLADNAVGKKCSVTIIRATEKLQLTIVPTESVSL